MSHYKPYPAYKDSGVEWIGPVPEHWEVAPMKRAASLRNERRNDSPDGWTYIGLEDVEPESGKYAPTEGASRQTEDSMVGVHRAGDVLYGKLRPYLRKAIVADQDGLCSTEFLVLSPRRSTAPWLHRWLLTPEVTQQIEAGCDGAKMPRADWEHVGSIPIPLPPFAEQTAIATVIDREIARIDALIAKKTRFIELLKEKRQALITHAVTKGLDPNVKMKDSGVAWIGEVPEGWKVLALKRMGTLKGGNGFPPSMQGREGNEFPFYKVGDLGKSIDGMSLGETRHSISKEDAANLGATIFKPGALAWAKIGAALSLNRRRVIRSACCLDNNMTGFTPDASVASTTYCFYLLSSIDFSLHAKPGAVPSFSEGDQGELMVTCPSLEEQCGIVNFLDRETARIDALIAKTQHSIDLLKERRSAFITAAVTGQIDLREEA